MKQELGVGKHNHRHVISTLRSFSIQKLQRVSLIVVPSPHWLEGEESLWGKEDSEANRDTQRGWGSLAQTTVGKEGWYRWSLWVWALSPNRLRLSFLSVPCSIPYMEQISARTCWQNASIPCNWRWLSGSQQDIDGIYTNERTPAERWCSWGWITVEGRKLQIHGPLFAQTTSKAPNLILYL